MTAPVPRRLLRVLLVAALMAAGGAGAVASACTIGVASGDATPDGRPLVWKVRDNPPVPDNEVYWNTSLDVPFLAVVTADGMPESPAWMGVNRHGFAVVNSNAGDLSTPPITANGEFMRTALGTCWSVRDFLNLLETTNGLRDTHGNFAVIDTTGAALVIEASRDSFWTYDTRDTERGFIVRTNFACVDTAGSGIGDLAGNERFVRSSDMVGGWVDENDLTVANLVGRHARDISDWASQPVAIPCFDCNDPDSLYGCYDTFFSISAGATVSGAVIRGVAPPPSGEPGRLSTMWVHLGQPNTTVAVPYWPVGPAPAMANGDTTAALCDLANELRRLEVFPVPYYPRIMDTIALDDGAGGGLWSLFLPWEEAARAVVAGRMEWWRRSPPEVGVMLAVSDSLADSAYELLGMDVMTGVGEPAPAAGGSVVIGAQPNPFNPATTLVFELPRAGHARLDVFDLGGRRVARLVDGVLGAGPHRVDWRPVALASGVYLARLKTDGGIGRQRLVLVR